MNEKLDNRLSHFCVKNTTCQPEITRASLRYLRRLPNTTEEIGRKY